MVRQCQVCGKTSQLNHDLSFHRFPADPERRNAWLCLVNLTRDRLPKKPEICSNHFSPFDIEKPSGLRCIRPGANPELIDFWGQSEESIVYSTEVKEELDSVVPTSSLTYSTPLNTNLHENITIKVEDESHHNEQENTSEYIVNSPSAESNIIVKEEVIIEHCLEETPHCPTPETDTASEGEDENHYIDFGSIEVKKEIEVPFEPEVPVKRRRSKRRTAYVGDLTIDDFSTPEEATRNLDIVKRKVTEQSRRIKLLQMTVKRLKIKVASLETELKTVLGESFTSES